MVRFTFILAFVIHHFHGYGKSPTERISLKQAVEIAINHSVRLSKERDNLFIADLRIQNAHAAFLPRIDLTISPSYVDPLKPQNAASYGSRLSLGVSTNLYNSGIDRIHYESAKIERDVINIGYEKEKESLAHTLCKLYLAYTKAVSLSKVQVEQHEIVKASYELMETQYKQGIKTTTDYLRTKTDYLRSKMELEKAESTITTSEQNLAQRLKKPLSELEVSYEFIPLNIRLQKDVVRIPKNQANIKANQTFKLFDLQKSVMQKDLDAQRKGLWPVSVTLGAYYDANAFATERMSKYQDTLNWQARIDINLPLWDFGVKRRELVIAEHLVEQQKAEMSLSLEQLSFDAKQNLFKLQMAEKDYHLSLTLLELEDKNYNLLESESRLGKVSYLDLVNARQNLLNAKIACYSLLFELKSLLLDYHSYEGKVYETLSDV